MDLPNAYQVLTVSPRFIRNNQYNPRYKVIDETYYEEEFKHLMNLYPNAMCKFPSGECCFMLLVADTFTLSCAPSIG